MASPDFSAHLTLTFHGDTLELLRATPDKNNTVIYPLSRRASIKDILEGLGLPHTEVGRITQDDRELTFAVVPKGGEHLAVHPWSPAISPILPTLLRPQPLAACTFLVDNNVGKLARLLRMAGLDARIVPLDIGGARVATAVDMGRILLTRNRDLLRYRELVFGRLIRSDNPEQQLRETIKLYRLHDQLKPFSRCMSCNGILTDIDKETILDRLLPLTKKYYGRFSHCPDCGKIYWRGSHHQRMARRLDTLLHENFLIR